MKTIALKHGTLAYVDDNDYERINQYKWHVNIQHMTNGKISRTYAQGGPSNIDMMHRLVMGLTKGDGICVDHINGNGLDNQRANLRLCTKAQNLANRGKATKNTSGYKGAYLVGAKTGKHPTVKPWFAAISIDNKLIHLGRFDTATDAAKAYDVAAKAHWKEFAQLNFPASVN